MSIIQINITSASTDQIMRKPPNYRPRHSGMRTYRYTAADCDCRFCLHSKHCDKCVCFYERLYAGCVPYSEIIAWLADEIVDAYVSERIKAILKSIKPNRKEVTDMFFYDGKHKDRWSVCEKMGIIPPDISEPSDKSKAHVAALFLLSADRQLWDISSLHLYQDRIAFADIDIRGISTDGYTLFKAAKEMHSGVQQIFPSELIDSDIIDDKLFKVIINAFAVRRAGASILKKR